jgi:hypothetical protein
MAAWTIPAKGDNKYAPQINQLRQLAHQLLVQLFVCCLGLFQLVSLFLHEVCFHWCHDFFQLTGLEEEGSAPGVGNALLSRPSASAR